MSILKNLKQHLKRLPCYIHEVEKTEVIQAPLIFMFLQSSYQTVTIRKSCRSPATIRNYITAINAFRQFLEEKGIDSRKTPMKSQIIEQFAMWLRYKGISPNTIACYMRSMRALYNYTCKYSPSPFYNISTSNARTQKRAMDIEDVNALIDIDLTDSLWLQMYRDVFVFSIYAFGMPFIDVYHMRHNNIHDKILVYYRHKTGQKIEVPVSDKMMNIINKYQMNNSPYIFPLLHNSEDTNDYNKYQKQLMYYNRALHLLAKKAGINRKLTSYVARHTWASIASDNGISTAQISSALGHTNIKTTQIYLNELDEKKMWMVCDNVMEAINKKSCQLNKK